MVGDHGAEVAIVAGLGRFDTEPRCEHTIERRWLAATLYVAQDGSAGLKAGLLGNRTGDEFADTAELYVPELIEGVLGNVERIWLRLSALSNDNDRGVLAALVTPLDRFADLVDVERLLRNQGDRGSTGEASPGSDMADVAAHYLDDHDAVVALCGGVQTADGLGGDVDRGCKPEGELGQADVVVDRLGNAEYGKAQLVHLVGARQRALATDRDQRVYAFNVERLAAEVPTVVLHERVDAGSSEHGATTGQ